MLEELLKEINELKEYKERYELANKDKEQMSDLLYDYMMKEYIQMTDEERITKYKKEYCCNCRRKHVCEYNCNLPENIMKPVPSKDAWIPRVIGCKYFL